MFAARIVGTGWASAVATAITLALLTSLGVSGAASADPPTAPPCIAGQLRAGYTAVPFSQGAGVVSYLLTVRNRSQQACTLTPPLSMQLLDRERRPLATDADSPGAGYQVVLAPGQWAQALSRFSPDIAGPGENPSECEPPAHFLALQIGNDRLLARMDPSPVCENGTIEFDRLNAAPPTPPCDAESLAASFQQASPPYEGSTAYYLVLRNVGGDACETSSFVGLTLLAGAGNPVPTRMLVGIPSPYVIPSAGEEYAVATLRTSAGPGEPSRGPCEPLATQVVIAPSRRGGTLTVPIEPPLHACRGGAISLSGLYPAGS